MSKNMIYYVTKKLNKKKDLKNSKYDLDLSVCISRFMIFKNEVFLHLG